MRAAWQKATARAQNLARVRSSLTFHRGEISSTSCNRCFCKLELSDIAAAADVAWCVSFQLGFSRNANRKLCFYAVKSFFLLRSAGCTELNQKWLLYKRDGRFSIRMQMNLGKIAVLGWHSRFVILNNLITENFQKRRWMIRISLKETLNGVRKI